MTRVSDSEFDTSHRKVWAPSLGVQRIQAGHHLLHRPCPSHSGQSTPTLDSPSGGFEALSTHSYHTRVDSCAVKEACMDAMCPMSSRLADIPESSCSLHPSCQQTTAPPGLPDAVVQRNERRRGPCAHARCFRGEHPRTTCRVTFDHHDTSLYARTGTPTRRTTSKTRVETHGKPDTSPDVSRSSWCSWHSPLFSGAKACFAVRAKTTEAAQPARPLNLAACEDVQNFLSQPR